MVLASLVAEYLPVSASVVALVIIAYHGREAFALASSLGRQLRIAAVIGTLLALGVATGVIEASIDMAALSWLAEPMGALLHGLGELVGEILGS